jgi:hypothetical protein
MLEKIAELENKVSENPNFKKVEKYFFVNHVIKWLSDGFVFRTAASLFMKAGALYFVFEALWGSGDSSWIKYWGDIGDLESKILPSALITQVAGLLVIYAVAHLMFNRAHKIQNLPAGEINVTPIFVVSLRLIGEILAVSLFVFGVAGSICLLINGDDAGQAGLATVDAVQSAGGIFEMYPGIIGENLEEFGEVGGEANLGYFLHGLKATVVGTLATAFIWYLIAEILNLLVSTCLNIAKLANRQS